MFCVGLRQIFVLLMMLLWSCSSGESVSNDATATGDTANTTSCEFANAGEACAPDGASCENTMTWCGEEISESGCNCNNGKWECWSAGAPAPCCSGCTQDEEGNACCAEHNGPDFVCGSEGQCVESLLCTAPHCCLEGADGDAYCAENYGSCSSCSNGTCTPLNCCEDAEPGESCMSLGQVCETKGEHCGEELVMSSCECVGGSWLCAMVDLAPCCTGCEQNNEGHACCAEFNTEMFFCGASGSCVEAPICDSADCCVPGDPGDTYCKDTFEECSFCIAKEGHGMCSRTACPDYCTQDVAGHDACQEENGFNYFCGSEESCIPASGCKALQCCVPGTTGNQHCAANFGDCSTCVVKDDDGRCEPMGCE